MITHFFQSTYNNEMSSNIDEICAILLKKNCAILPSDTLYGIAALAYEKEAVEKVFEIKGRGFDKKLPIHYASIEQISQDVEITPTIEKLTKHFLPGALTIIAKKKPTSKLAFLEETVGFRIPKHQDLLAIIRKINQPITMPSANKHGIPPHMHFKLIQEELQIPGLENDATVNGVQSTIVDVTSGTLRLIRTGAVPFHEIAQIMG